MRYIMYTLIIISINVFWLMLEHVEDKTTAFLIAIWGAAEIATLSFGLFTLISKGVI